MNYTWVSCGHWTSLIHLMLQIQKKRLSPTELLKIEISILILPFTAIVSFPNIYLILTFTSISISSLKETIDMPNNEVSSCCLKGTLSETSWPIFIPKHLIICKLVSIDGCQVKPKTQAFKDPLLPCLLVLRPIVFSQMFNLKYPSCS